MSVLRAFVATCRFEFARLVILSLAPMALAGCNVHPIVDDVSPIPNENIIASARCELRHGLEHDHP